jgi:uncharacterized protein
MIKKICLMIWHLPRNIAILLIMAYQNTLSPDHGPLNFLFPNGYCKFRPTCSEYGVLAYKKYGFIKGSFKTLYRILRCNPCSKGGLDTP